MVQDHPLVPPAGVSALVLGHVPGVVGGLADQAVVDLVAEQGTVVRGGRIDSGDCLLQRDRRQVRE